MRRSIVPLLVVVACLAALLWWKSQPEATDRGGWPRAEGSGTTVAGSASENGDKPVAHAKKVTPEEHRSLADRIAAAQRARAGTHAAPPRPSLPPTAEGSGTALDHLVVDVRDALQEAIPFLAECYTVNAPASAKPGFTAVARMTLTGDPDIGTVIDADQIFDDKQQPIDKKLDDCLRNTMQTLALPPIPDGEPVTIQYSFRFEDK